ncbi:alpha-L-fucosidase [Embleya scabrispora]|uniref:alpha-L-fucosidase n=1 Tax=Embleya scabrispora TaxID=159449 RepID=UPI000371056C|nr:alpha-L-fucosidase [Embleya scabrispora]MYS85366.1 alpha-L-fucosidase [Streptomyces sp. SID5474]
MSASTPGHDDPVRPLPGWFDDAKLGVMITWGLYSVPAWAPLDDRLVRLLAEHGDGADRDRSYHAEADADGFDPIVTTSYSEWYLNSVSVPGSPTWHHHRETYGDRTYADFRGDFAAAVEQWSPEPWAELCAAAGARYVVPLAKHHDGFLMWPSSTPNPHRPDWALERDVLGEFREAVRVRGMRFGIYYSGGIDWTFANLPILRADDVARAVPHSPEYAAYADAHWRELVERYEPAVLWNDIGYPPAAEPEKLFADYRRAVPDGVVNERFYAGTPDFVTPEYATRATSGGTKWETVRGVGLSFGYNRQEDASWTTSGPDLVELLVDVVSKGGNLLLGIGPDAAGRISPEQDAALRELGAWLAVNGDAVYGSRSWHVAEDRTAEGLRVRYTERDGDLYVTFLDRPSAGVSAPERLAGAADAGCVWLGGDGTVGTLGSLAGLPVPPVRDGVPEPAVLRISPAPEPM